MNVISPSAVYRAALRFDVAALWRGWDEYCAEND
jgi:hypothetical protein